MAYQLATGSRPFQDTMGSFEGLIDKVMNEDVPAIQGRSPQFTDFVQKCLLRDPEQRWTIEALLNHEFLQSNEMNCLDAWQQTYEQWAANQQLEN